MSDVLLSLGTSLGAVTAAAVGSYFTLLRPLAKRADETESKSVDKSQVDELKDSMAMLRDRVTHLESDSKHAAEYRQSTDARLGRIEQDLKRTVSDEEFATHTKETTKVVNQLTDKLGRAIGVLESWNRHR
jgi:molybdopterin converting factor small subunit